jgi:hypothetical protein
MSRPGDTCFGYSIITDLDFQFLRPGDGEPLRVYEHTERGLPSPEALLWQEWPSDETQQFTVALYRGDRHHELRMGDEWFLIDPAEPSVGVPPDGDPLGREERAWGLPLMLCFHGRGDLPLHAAAVAVGGRALVVGAPTRSGKTTLAAGFWREGHRVLTEDLACVRPGETPSVVPGPAMIRLRPDMAERLGVASMAGVVSGRGRFRVRVADPLGGGSDPVPLGAVVLILGESDEIRIEAVDPVAAIPLLWDIAFRLPEPFDAGRSFADIADLVARVPVLGLWRPLTVESLPHVVEALASRA